jgi:diguanylate cyclase (GGDEF)-like protein
MRLKTNKENLYLSLLMPLAVAAFVWAVFGIEAALIDWRLGVLTIVTVFFSSLLRIQLPRINIHVTISDAAIIISFLWYGGEVAIILALLESVFTSVSYKHRGGKIRNKTIAINAVIATVAVFITTLTVRAVFGTAPMITNGEDTSRFVWLLAALAFLLFFLNSSLVSVFVSAKSDDKPMLSVWTEYCLNALVIYLTSAVLAGFTVKAIQQINTALFSAVGIFFAVVYFTYRRYINDIRSTAAKAEQAERNRAEQAELHLQELQHYVQKLEQSSQELQQSHERLHHAAYHDALTGLPNKYYFVETIKTLLRKLRDNTGRTFAVLYLDLNRFKTINDSIGHTRGDKMIRAVATRLRDVVDADSIIGRFSGDEFAILVPGFRSERDVIEMAERITNALSQPFALFGRNVFTSASIGIAYGSRGYKRAEYVLRDADIAMYKAKESRKKYVVFGEEMHASAVHLMQMETDLRLGIERREFQAYYQPIVDLRTLELAGFEALVRWDHPTRGIVSPSHFVDICESTDLIIPLTLQILEESCRQVNRWNEQRLERPLFVSVNLSGKHFDHPDLVNHVQTVLAETGFDPQNLKLEITETALMDNAGSAIEMLRDLKTLGAQISIDDFGTGYSSLSYLHKFPLDTMKIDRSFVGALGMSSENGEIVRTIVYLAKVLDLKVVAEGIESIRQLDELKSLGCEYGQGYLFSRPLAADMIEPLLHASEYWHGISIAKESMPAEHGKEPHVLGLVS